MITQGIVFKVGFLIERRTRVYGRLKPEPIIFGRCGINRQVRARVIHELFGQEIPMQILKRNKLHEGGFAGLKEHRLVKEPKLFGPQENNDGSWPGLGNFVYLADARFMPHGETRMHSHHEIDVISVMIKGNIRHEGSLGHGNDLAQGDVQVQRAGGEGFSHNEINPDDDWNRMIQLWVLPEIAGQPASYKVYAPQSGELMGIYGGTSTAKTDFPSKTKIDVGFLGDGQQFEMDGLFMAYLTHGKGLANDELVEEGDLIRGDTLLFNALEDVQLIVIHTQGVDS